MRTRLQRTQHPIICPPPRPSENRNSCVADGTPYICRQNEPSGRGVYANLEYVYNLKYTRASVHDCASQIRRFIIFYYYLTLRDCVLLLRAAVDVFCVGASMPNGSISLALPACSLFTCSLFVASLSLSGCLSVSVASLHFITCCVCVR